VPPGFPYFYVQFGYSAGFAHVIDDEGKFDRDFGGWSHQEHGEVA
jgi:hypothetical protein